MTKKNLLSKSLFSLTLLALNSCAVQIPNVKACAVAGVLEAGMDCIHTLSDDESYIPALEIREFLEPQESILGEDGSVLVQGHGAAICQSSEDYAKEHAALEAACQKLGPGCSYDIKKIINSVNAKVESLQKLKK